MSKFAPGYEGLFAYVVTTMWWGKSSDRIEWAQSLKNAKDRFGWTRAEHTTIRVRRATVEDLESAITNRLPS